MDEVNKLIIKAIEKDVFDIQAENDRLREAFNKIEGIDIADEVNLFNQLIQYLPLNENTDLIRSEERWTEIFNKLSLTGSMHSQIDIIDDKLSLAASTSTSMSILRPIFNGIKSKLKSLSTHLWQLLSHLIIPKEWSIKGGLTTPNFYGLAGNVQIQLTFV